MPRAAWFFAFLSVLASFAQWAPANPLKTARQWHSATLLQDGRVLVAGGKGINAVLPPNAEIYDPASGDRQSGGTLNVPRIFHTATLLTNGTVLTKKCQKQKSKPCKALAVVCIYRPITGGQSAEEIGQSSTEIYNPSINQWTLGASLLQGRDSHSATLLPDGRVLVAGGEGECPSHHGFCVLASAEIYDPATNQRSMTGHMHVRRENHTATRLPNGQVLVVGGTNALPSSQYGIAVCELYDPSTGTWSITGEMSVRRSEFTANLLPNGQVLVAGGGGTIKRVGFRLTACAVGRPCPSTTRRNARAWPTLRAA